MKNLLASFTKLSQSILGKSAVAFAIKILSAGLNFVYNLILANLLGVEHTGQYFLAFSIFALTRVISLLGLQNAILKYISAADAEGDVKRLNLIINSSAKYVLIASSLCTILIILFGSWISATVFKDPSIREPIRLMALSIVPSSLILLLSQTLKGVGRYKHSLFLEGIGIPLLGIILMPILVHNFNINGAIISLFLSHFLVFIIALGLVKKYILKNQTFKLTNDVTERRFWNMALSMLIIELLNFGFANGDIIILGVLLEDNSDIGIYAICQRLSILVGFIIVAVNSVIAPKFSSLFALGKMEELTELVQKSSYLLIVVSLPILLIYLAFPTQLLALFGVAFKEGSLVLCILAVGQFVRVSTGSVGALLIMSGFEKVMRNNIIISSLGILFLHILLIPKYGIIGAAISSALGVSVKNMIAVYLAKSKLDIDFIAFKAVGDLFTKSK